MVSTVYPFVPWTARSPVRADWALTVLLLGVIMAADGCRPPPATASIRLVERARCMAVPWTITVHATDAATGRRAIAAAWAEIRRLEGILSDYDPDSELVRLSAAAPTPEPVSVSEDLWRVFVRAAEIRDAMAGAFDVTVGPLTSLWRRARRAGRLPPPDKLASSLASVGAESLLLDPASRSVRLTRPDMRLDAGGIGRGYAIDRAMAALAAHGITAAMIDCSGDVAVSGPPPGAPGWRIAVKPFADAVVAEPLILVHAAVTTSGDAYQSVTIDGIRYSHIVDPRTGLGVTGQTAVTVVAPDATTADALATALSVLGPDRGLDALKAFPTCSARFAWIESGQPSVRESPGWPQPGRRGA